MLLVTKVTKDLPLDRLDSLGLDASSSASNRWAATSYMHSTLNHNDTAIYCDGIKEMPYRWVCFTRNEHQNWKKTTALSFRKSVLGFWEKTHVGCILMQYSHEAQND